MYANGMSQAIQSKPFLFRDDSTIAFWYKDADVKKCYQ